MIVEQKVILIGDFLESVANQIVSEGFDLTVWTAIICLLLVFPLCLRQKMNDLRVVSFLSICFICFYVVSIFIKARKGLANGVGPGVEWIRFDLNFFRSLPVSTFAYFVHTSALPIFREMEHPKTQQFARVSRVSFAIVAILYWSAALLAYLMIGSGVGE